MKLGLITLEILHPCLLVSSTFTVCFITFQGNKLLLVTIVDLYKLALLISNVTGSLGWGSETAVAFNLIVEVYYSICIKCSLYCIFAFRQGRKVKGLDKRTLVLCLGVMIPPVTLVMELDLGLSSARLCPRLSWLYAHFIITIIYYYQLYFVQFTPWKRQTELRKHFVERHPPSIKFTIVLASHTLLIRNYLYSVSCKFDSWNMQCYFDVDLTLYHVATSYQPKENVETPLECLLGKALKLIE